MKKLFILLIFVSFSLDSAENEYSRNDETYEESSGDVTDYTGWGIKRSEVEQHYSAVEAERVKEASTKEENEAETLLKDTGISIEQIGLEQPSAEIEDSPEKYKEYRKKNLKEAMEKSNINDLINSYEALIQKMKSEGIDEDYPELVAESYNNLFDLYKKQLEDLLESGKSNEDDTVSVLFKKMKKDFKKANKTYATFDTELQKLIIKDMDDFLKRYHTKIEATSSKLLPDLQNQLNKAIQDFKEQQEKQKEKIKDQIKQASSVRDLDNISKNLFKFLKGKSDIDVLKLKDFFMEKLKELVNQNIQNLSVELLSKKIQELMVGAYQSTSLIKSGYQPETTQQLNIYLDLIKKRVVELNNSGVLSDEFLNYMKVAYELNNSVQKYVDLLRPKYGDFFSKDPDNPSLYKFNFPEGENLTQEEYTYLKRIQHTLKDELAKGDNSINELMRTLIEQVKISSVKDFNLIKEFYKNQDINNLNDLVDANSFFKKYKKFLNNWSKEKNIVDLIDYYKSKVLKNEKITDQKAAEKLLNKLSGLDYIMSKKIERDTPLLNKPKLSSSREQRFELREKNREQVREIIKKIHEKYPEMLSRFDKSRLYQNKNKIPRAVFDLLQAGNNASSHLLGEINTIINAAEKNNPALKRAPGYTLNL